MALVSLSGVPLVQIGSGFATPANNTPTNTVSVTLDAANEAIIFVGYVVTSDGGSHTINTTGSSSLGWRTSAVTFADAATAVKVGLAAVDTATGPPARAVNAANVITFDVSKTLTGGGGGITATAWQTHIPDTGTKTIANGDFVAFCVQMTARGGTDSVIGTVINNAQHTIPIVTGYTGGTYAVVGGVPNAVITFADGAIGCFYGGEVFNTLSGRFWNGTTGTVEYGQLFNLPFPLQIYGMYGWAFFQSDLDIVLYSAPLSGSPIAEKTISVDANTVSQLASRKFHVLFPTPYTYVANTDIAAVFKPGAGDVQAFYKVLSSAAHREAEPFGTSGYGISRATGAFANANSSLDHYYIGLLAGAFDAGGGGGGRAVQINATSLVA